jgi:hypothetical protein
VQIEAEHLRRDEPAVTKVLIVLLAALAFLWVFQVLLVFWLLACLGGIFRNELAPLPPQAQRIRRSGPPADNR